MAHLGDGVHLLSAHMAGSIKFRKAVLNPGLGIRVISVKDVAPWGIL